MNRIYYRSVFVKMKTSEDIKIRYSQACIYVTSIPALNSLFRMWILFVYCGTV